MWRLVAISTSNNCLPFKFQQRSLGCGAGGRTEELAGPRRPDLMPLPMAGEVVHPVAAAEVGTPFLSHTVLDARLPEFSNSPLQQLVCSQAMNTLHSLTWATLTCRNAQVVASPPRSPVIRASGEFGQSESCLHTLAYLK